MFLWRNKKYQGPVVQSVVSLTSLLRVILLTILADSIYKLVKGHFVNYFSRFNIQYSDIFC